MFDRTTSIRDRFLKPEHTGENRCHLCTVLNVAVALAASASVALLSIPVAVIVFVSSLAAIYFRGYLVPKTPALTERYLPDRVLSLIDTHPFEEPESDEGAWETLERLEHRRKNAIDPERFLLDIGAVEPYGQEDDLHLTDAFACLLDDEGDAHSEATLDHDAVADVFDTDPDSITIAERTYPAVRVDRRVRKWPSEVALVADLAADSALRRLTDRWVEVPVEQRLGILSSLRLFRERCPRCGNEIVLSDGTVESCCRTYEVRAVGCVGCSASLIEFGSEDDRLPEAETGIQS